MRTVRCKPRGGRAKAHVRFAIALLLAARVVADHEPTLVIGGVFTIDSEPAALAHFETWSRLWASSYEPKLYRYGAASGSVFDLVVDRRPVPPTSLEDGMTSAGDEMMRPDKNSGVNPDERLVVVGSFDTVCRTCQAEYCSVGQWDGMIFGKVGEGLCASTSHSGIKIMTTALGRGGDIYVGGSFVSRVWTGEDFVEIHHVARFLWDKQLWLPLNGGELKCRACGWGQTVTTSSSADNATSAAPGAAEAPLEQQEATVRALAFDDENYVLFIGGSFDCISQTTIPPGLATWDPDHGIGRFPGGGVWGPTEGSAGHVTSLYYDASIRGLYVAGRFARVDTVPCHNVALWKDGMWFCLSPVTANDDGSAKTISSSTTIISSDGPSTPVSIGGLPVLEEVECMAVAHPLERTGKGEMVMYLAGRAASNSSWTDASSPFTITRAVLDVTAKHKHADSLQHSDATDLSDSRSAGEKKRMRGERAMMRKRKKSPLSSSSSSDDDHDDEDDEGKKGSTSDSPDNSDSSPSTVINETIVSVTWEWLPSFNGVNDQIRVILPGSLDLEGALVIGGDFNGPSPVLLWTPERSGEGSTRPLGRPGQLIGQVRAMAQLRVMAESSPPGGVAPLGWLYGWKLLAVGVLAGALLGILAALIFRYQAESTTFRYSFLKSVNDGKGIPLNNLAPGTVELDLALSFERAMQARYLGRRSNLTIIDPSEIVLQRIIGEGSFGRVWQAMWLSSEVAVKEFVLAQTALSASVKSKEDTIQEIVGEAGLMSYLRHPKILQLYGCSLTPQAVWIVSEFCQRGSLRQVLNDPNVRLTLTARLGMALDVAEGMLYLHTRDPPIIHRDLKSHNLFVVEQSGGQYTVRIGDWGSARAMDTLGGDGRSRTMTFGVGTASWLAPEVIRLAQGSKMSDVYSFGIVLWELATREEVYSGLSAAQIISKVANERLRPPVPRACPWAQIMVECWAEDPQRRPGFNEIVLRITNVLSKLDKMHRANTKHSPTEHTRLSHAHSGSSSGGGDASSAHPPGTYGSGDAADCLPLAGHDKKVSGTPHTRTSSMGEPTCSHPSESVGRTESADVDPPLTSSVASVHVEDRRQDGIGGGGGGQSKGAAERRVSSSDT